jgi:hypothetical protein
MLQQRAAQRSEVHVNTREGTAHEHFVEDASTAYDCIILRASNVDKRLSKLEGFNPWQRYQQSRH